MIARKPARCKFCRQRLEKVGAVLHDACIDPWIAAQTAKQARAREAKRKAAAKVERAQIKARRRNLETIPELIKKAQYAFNAFIRTRDAGLPCICCGRTETQVTGLGSHGWDAGHYRSTGSASHLRFNESNCHRQLVLCNRYGAGRAVDYRLGLLKRIGREAVEALEANNTPHKWTADELRAIRATYKEKLRLLKEKAE